MTTLLFVVAALASVPAAIVGIECLLALLPLRRPRPLSEDSATARYAVLVPAHNEEDWIVHTIGRLKQQVDEQGQIIVIADNCSDATAKRAAAAGATVWERNDSTRLGKAYAMNFAFERLAENPPDAVVCIDADCVPGPSAVPTLARLAHQLGQPVQAAYRMYAPETQRGMGQISAFAVYVKNVIRPRGLQRLGLPCMLNGSGMAFPWSAVAAVPYPAEHLADDYRLTSDMAAAGFLPVPCMELSVSSVLPDQRSGFLAQRTRWEQGHMAVVLYEPPRLLAAGLRHRSWRTLMLIPEMSVPPLSFLASLTLACTLLFATASLGIGSWWPLVGYGGGVSLGVIGLASVWLREGREYLPWRVVLQIPKYVAIKAPVYSRFVTNRQRTWLRTDRGTFRVDAGQAEVLGPTAAAGVGDPAPPRRG